MRLTDKYGTAELYSQTTEEIVAHSRYGPTFYDAPFMQSVSAPPRVGERAQARYLANPGYPSSVTTYHWYACSLQGDLETSAPDDCVLRKSGSNYASRFYDVATADIGLYLRIGITLENELGSATLISETTEAVVPPLEYLPVLNREPAISGTPMASLRLSTTSGRWTANPGVTSITYQWLRCTGSGSGTDTDPGNCVARPSTTAGYTVVAGDIGKYLRSHITATNANGSSEFWSASTAVVVAYAQQAPAASNAPCLSAEDPLYPSTTITSSCRISWSAVPAVLGDATSWWRCNAEGDEILSATSIGGCVQVQTDLPRPLSTGGYEPMYLTSVSDLGKYLRLATSASNKAGRSTTWSATVGPVVDAPTEVKPEPVFAPEIYADPQVGEWVWQDGGTWVEYGAADYPSISSWSTVWLRCADEGESSLTEPDGCIEASGRTRDETNGYRPGPTAYLPTATDVGFYLRAAVTATSRAGTTTVWSATSAVVPEPPSTLPTATQPVVIYHHTDSAIAYRDWPLRDWSAYPPIGEVRFQWYRCTGGYGGAVDSLPIGCTAIPDATQWGYSYSPADAGYRLRLREYAENVVGSAVSFSATTSVLTSPEPTNAGGASAPRTSGATIIGGIITVSTGIWSTPRDLGLTYEYQWYSCTSGGSATPTTKPGDCSEIADATGSSLAIGADLDGAYLRARVTATNERASAVRFSAATGQVAIAPSNSRAPTVAGTAQVNAVLTGWAGLWSGTPSMNYSWWRCTGRGTTTPSTPPTGCTIIDGADGLSYTATSADVGKFLRVAVVASAGGYSVTKFSKTFGPIKLSRR